MKAYYGIEKCDCPLGVKYYVSTPLGPETLNNDLQINPVMLGDTLGGDNNKAKSGDKADDNKKASDDHKAATHNKDDHNKKASDDHKAANDKDKNDHNKASDNHKADNKDDKNKASDSHPTDNSKTNEHPKVQSKKGNGLKIKFDTGGYIFIVCMVFVGQIIIVLWIKFIYLKRRQKKSDKRFYERADKFQVF